MIRRLKITNYRAISELMLDLQHVNLLMGLNGCGKSSVLDALAGVVEMVSRVRPVEHAFPLASLPRWLNGDSSGVFEQRFELELVAPGGAVTYKLALEHNRHLGASRVASEVLLLDDKPMFTFHLGEVQLYHRDFSPGPVYRFDWTRSAIGTVLRPEFEEIEWFRDFLSKVWCLSIDARHMIGRAESESAYPERDLSNFASWYRHALGANMAAGVDYLKAIQEVLPGLRSLDLHELGQGVRELRARFERRVEEPAANGRDRSADFVLDFAELSDGQRALIGLYAVLHFVVRAGGILCIDEPDNFVSLAEIQPWLLEIEESADQSGAQVIISSHHPEIINMLASDCGIELERKRSEPTTSRPYRRDAESNLEPAERVARGWDRV